MYKPLVLVVSVALALSACAPANPDTLQGLDSGATSADKSAQQLFDQGKIVCKDGYAYLMGWVGSYHGGPWATPYMRDGKQGRCVTPEQQKSTVEFEGV